MCGEIAWKSRIEAESRERLDEQRKKDAEGASRGRLSFFSRKMQESLMKSLQHQGAQEVAKDAKPPVQKKKCPERKYGSKRGNAENQRGN